MLLEHMTCNFHGSHGGKLLGHVDQVLERHVVVVPRGDLWLNVGLPYLHAGGVDYIIPIQH
jgi:hypothetical protein